MTIVRQFHGWKIPSLPAAVDVLSREWLEGGGRGPLDLRGCLIVVPTRHAGRRLRAELARVAADKGSAVLSGAIVTPEHLLPLPAAAAADSAALALLAQRLLARHDDLPALFPVAGADWTFSFALGIAEQIQHGRRQLAAPDRSAADLLPLVPDAEKDRWTEIVQLEKGLLQDFRKRGWQDPLLARREAARQPPASTPYSRVVSLFVPDYSALAARALQTLAATCEVRLHVLAPESEAERFDAWGRPLPDRWENEPLPIAESQIHVFAQAPDETDSLADALLEADRHNRALAICLPDPAGAQALARRLQMEGRPLYLPNGVSLAATAPGRLLAAWLSLLRRKDYVSTAAFLRHPDAQEGLLRKLDLADARDLLSQLDQCQAEHLPSTFDDLLRFARRQETCSVLARALEELEKLFADPLPDVLAELYDCRPPAAVPDPLFAEAAKSLADLIRSTGESARQLELGAEEAIDLLLSALPREQVFPRPNSSVVRETTGWLEVQWETAPALLLADVREGIVPETRIGDAFLPDSIRARAGIAGNRESFARDLFLARALLASRPANGVRFLYSRRAANQDPQIPSRLLLACPEDELPARVALLFARPALRAPRAAAPARPVLRVSPPACPRDRIPTSLSVTAFRTYLACPFRFYLSQVLRMRSEDDGARELDPLGFGSLAHEALSLLNRHPALEDEEPIRALLLAELDRLAKQRFGPHPPLALVFQLDTLRQRLRAAAQVHAASVREGWRIVSAEETFAAELDGMLLRARIDRIDRHAGDGRLRILDYKTTDAGDLPADTHYQPRKKAWIDLQLPLYRYIYGQLHPGCAISVGYFNLPKASAATGIHALEFIAKDGEDLFPSALAAARAVIAGIQAGKFWPPETLRPDGDDFALLFAGNPPLIEELPSP